MYTRYAQIVSEEAGYVYERCDSDINFYWEYDITPKTVLKPDQYPSQLKDSRF